jgi:hypothetical protein
VLKIKTLLSPREHRVELQHGRNHFSENGTKILARTGSAGFCNKFQKRAARPDIPRAALLLGFLSLTL